MKTKWKVNGKNWQHFNEITNPSIDTFSSQLNMNERWGGQQIRSFDSKNSLNIYNENIQPLFTASSAAALACLDWLNI